MRQDGLRVYLLREHVAAEGDSAVEGHGGEISALTALHFGPSAQCRDDARERGADNVQQAEVRIDGAQTAALFRALGAKVEKLDDARVILAGSGTRDTCNVANLGRERLLNRSSDQRASVGDKELQQRSGGKKKYESSHYRGTTASRAVAMRASCGNRKKA